jgi:DNA repair exonuclease SbcCD nuclease subunit
MAKVLITADIHINDYRNHNLFDNPEFRLHQFKKLSQRLVSIIQERPEIEAVIIAGDFLHVAAPRPYVTNKAFEFLSNIAERCPVYLTHGQHDIDTRRTGIAENTLLSLCNHNKDVYYLHKESVTLGGCEFYFLGWVPNTEEEFANLERKGGTDVLIGHFQPGSNYPQ